METGVLKKAMNAKVKTKHDEYKEQLEMIGLEITPDKFIEGWSNLKYMNEYEDAIEADDMFSDAKEVVQLDTTEEITIQVITKDGYVFWITKNEVFYKCREEDLVEETTDMFIALKGDTLIFSKDEDVAMQAAEGGGEFYGNQKDRAFIRDNVNERPDTPYFKDKNKIKHAKFVDRVVLGDDMSYLFSDLDNLETVDLSLVKTANVKNMYGLFLNCRKLQSVNTTNINTKNVTNMGWMFLNCGNLKSIDLHDFDTRNVTDMSVMFSGCRSLTELDVSSFDTSNVTTMRSMFANLTLKQLILKNFNTSKVTNMETMFYSEEYSNLEYLDLSGFDTSNVENFKNMFFKHNKLKTLNLSNFNTNKATAVDMFGYGMSNSVEITTNEAMKTWINKNYPKFTNIKVVKANSNGET